MFSKDYGGVRRVWRTYINYTREFFNGKPSPLATWLS